MIPSFLNVVYTAGVEIRRDTQPHSSHSHTHTVNANPVYQIRLAQTQGHAGSPQMPENRIEWYWGGICIVEGLSVENGDCA